MPPDKMYLLENQRGARKTSRKEGEYLNYLARAWDVNIRTEFSHAEGQKRVGSYYCDGWVENDNDSSKDGRPTAVEFLGCVVHGHVVEDSTCPLSKNLTPASLNPYKKKMQDVHLEWLNRKAFLESRGIKVKQLAQFSGPSFLLCYLSFVGPLSHRFITCGSAPTTASRRRPPSCRPSWRSTTLKGSVHVNALPCVTH